MTVTNATKRAARLYSLAHDKAMKNIGPDVFRFQNDIVKHALVSVEIINIVNAQDEDSNSKVVRELLFDMSRLNAELYLENR